jgi:hypothetical protein
MTTKEGVAIRTGGGPNSFRLYVMARGSSTAVPFTASSFSFPFPLSLWVTDPSVPLAWVTACGVTSSIFGTEFDLEAMGSSVSGGGEDRTVMSCGGVDQVVATS